MLHKDRVCREVVGRYTEKAMHLRGVKRHRHDVSGPGRHQQVGNETASNRNARLVFLIGTGIRIVRNDGVDALGPRTPGHIKHEKHLQKVIAARWRDRLDDKHLFGPHTDPQVNVKVVIAELADDCRMKLKPHIVGDFLSEGRMSRAAKDQRVGQQITVIRQPGQNTPPRL